jgi:PPOX class probable F420-dependent enzyme
MDSTALAQQRHISITTFKRDGTPVSVPVWCAADNGTLLVISEADSWKVKRIRRNAHVRLAPCSARGTPRGPAVDADASLLAETTTVEALLARKYGWAWRGYRALMVSTALIRRLRRQLPTPWLTIRITLRQAAPDQPNLRGSGHLRQARSGRRSVRRPTPGRPGPRGQELGSAGGHGKTAPAPAGRKLGSGDPSRMAPIRDGLRLLAAVATAAVSRRPVRPLAGEAGRSLPGDELVADAKLGWTHAITIGARPAAIWPWLVQMGCRRAGWYSYDGLDNAAVPSADRILPQLQQVQVGDILPQTPTAEDRFVVRAVEPQRALVLGDNAGSMSWAFVLEPVGETGTRLITRSRGAYDRLALGLLLKLIWHPVHFGMQRRQLLNLKRRVEAAT